MPTKEQFSKTTRRTEKVVVPKFVAEWLDKHKYSTDIIDLFLSVEYATDSDGFISEKWDYSGEFYDWLNNSADVQFTLCDAMRYGYEGTIISRFIIRQRGDQHRIYF